MSIYCYTSCNFVYVSRARVLLNSLRARHPEWEFWLLLVDRPPENFDMSTIETEFGNVVFAEDLGFERFLAWLFKHDVVEACTAVKGQMLRYLLERGADKVVYLDPDIAVFHSLGAIVDRLDSHSVVLTPHQTDPERDLTAIRDNEVTSLQYGVFNLGFVAVKNDDIGRKFARWWAERLYFACYDEVPTGIFTDQKWCNLVPALFDRVFIERDPGCNLASWNLSHRRVEVTRRGDILVNGSPLKFYHFTKINSIGDIMTERYAQDNTEVYEIWNWYKRSLSHYTVPGIPRNYWRYGQFSNGVEISKGIRVFYRHREDLMSYFDDPYDVEGNSLYHWLERETPNLLADR